MVVAKWIHIGIVTQKVRLVQSLNEKCAVDLMGEDLSEMPEFCTTDDEVTSVEETIDGASFYITMDITVRAMQRMTFHSNKVTRKRCFT